MEIQEKTPDLHPGLGSQDLLAASLTAVLLGGWILFLMRQVSPSPPPQVLLRELCPSSLRPQPLCPPSSSDSVPCFLSAAPWSCARPRQAQLLAQHGAGPGQGPPCLGSRVSAAGAASRGKAAAGCPGPSRPSSHLPGCCVPALGGHAPGPEEAAKPLRASPAL